MAAGLESGLCHQLSTAPLEHPQCLGRTTGLVIGDHRQLVRAFPQRRVSDQQLDCCERFVDSAEFDQGRHASVECGLAQPIESLHLADEERRFAQGSEGSTAPQVERRIDHHQALVRLDRRITDGLANEIDEPFRRDRLPAQCQCVAVIAPDDSAIAKRATKTAQVALQRTDRLPGNRPVSPDEIDQARRRNRVAELDDQGAEQALLPRATDRYCSVAVRNREPTKDLDHRHLLDLQ